MSSHVSGAPDRNKQERAGSGIDMDALWTRPHGLKNAAGIIPRSKTRHNVPFGRSKTPFSSPDLSARARWPLKAVSDVAPRLLFAWMYFLIA